MPQPSDAPAERPLSPHLQVYRLPLPALLSISHRITGVGLAIGLLMLTWFFAALAAGPDAYASFESFCGNPIGALFLMGWSFAVCWHLCSGIRHLIFDTGHLFNLQNAYRSGYVVMAAAGVITLAVWLCAFTA